MDEPRQRKVTAERIREIFPDAVMRGDTSPILTSVADDSRKVTSGGIFVAVVGYETDGHIFLAQAVDAGAELLVVDKTHVENDPGLLSPVPGRPMLLVENTRLAASLLADEFYGHPSFETRVHGVTGTKGKTTTVHFIADIFRADGHSTATMGTLGIELDGEAWQTSLTTPGPIDFQKYLRILVDRGVDDVVCEVSAHAGALSRTASVRFETVTYMNLSRDHGDHFSTDEYLEAKLSISRDAAKVNPDVRGLANVRDIYAEDFLEPIATKKRFRFAAFETDEDTESPESNLYAQITGKSPDKLELLIHTESWERKVTLPLVGRFNAENAAGAAAVATVSGIRPQKITEGLSNAKQIPGRLERIDMGQPFLVVVDYAHAPQPAQEVLAALRETTRGRLIGVMGAGGSRDRGKRPMIGEVLARDCDIAVITSDNPRKEEPFDIINDIIVGTQRVREPHAEIIVEVDRRKAIETALDRALAGDTVAILGKGHETYQIFRDETIHFDDREVAREWLARKRYEK
jgi:UDP-N-acetylmuramoyl-L-alanyl-D-glutamate--2,6-diaminopimelate ligase